MRTTSGMRVSCVICVYNEADRIQCILDAVIGHPDVAEVIVVNDGSTDGTEDVLRRYEGITRISYAPNRGKTHALGRGISTARNDTVMLLDSDLTGVTAEDISALLQPVLDGRADVSLSLRRNSLGIYRMIGLDFVTGERVLPRSLLAPVVEEFDRLPRWGAEVFMNDRIIRAGLRIAVVDWKNVYNIRKYKKVGFIRGFLAEIGMVRDALSVVPLPQAVRQNAMMLKRKVNP